MADERSFNDEVLPLGVLKLRLRFAATSILGTLLGYSFSTLQTTQVLTVVTTCLMRIVTVNMSYRHAPTE